MELGFGGRVRGERARERERAKERFDCSTDTRLYWGGGSRHSRSSRSPPRPFGPGPGPDFGLKPEITTSKPKLRNPKPETQNPETRNPETETQKSEARIAQSRIPDQQRKSWTHRVPGSRVSGRAICKAKTLAQTAGWVALNTDW